MNDIIARETKAEIKNFPENSSDVSYLLSSFIRLLFFKKIFVAQNTLREGK